jgi:hypothetical protein
MVCYGFLNKRSSLAVLRFPQITTRFKLDSLDKKTEQTLLSPQEIDLKNCLNSRLAHLL